MLYKVTVIYYLVNKSPMVLSSRQESCDVSFTEWLVLRAGSSEWQVPALIWEIVSFFHFCCCFKDINKENRVPNESGLEDERPALNPELRKIIQFFKKSCRQGRSGLNKNIHLLVLYHTGTEWFLLCAKIVASSLPVQSWWRHPRFPLCAV